MRATLRDVADRGAILHTRPVRVAVVGLGTIGKRVARGVALQPDMVLAGIAVARPVAALLPELARGTPLFAAGEPRALREAGLPLAGDLADLLDAADVVADCTPRGVAARHLPTYRASGARIVLQGGEAADAAEVDFCASATYAAAIGRRCVRVVSCNTTGLARIVAALRTAGSVETLRGVLTRCAADPDKPSKGSPNALGVHLGPSHHGSDLKRLFPTLDALTLASSAPTNRGHLAQLFVRFARVPDLDTIRPALADAARIETRAGGPGSTAVLRAQAGGEDTHAVVVFAESLALSGAELSLSAAIHMEAIVVPDTIDAIRALCGEPSAAASIARTDAALRARAPAPHLEDQETGS